MNLSILDYGEKIESDNSHWSVTRDAINRVCTMVINFRQMTKDKGQMTNKQYRDLYER
ncbi:hypothetical protein NSTC731_06058 [Nostoc sp. DSM 114167]|jgi:hypothetical protein